MLEEIGAQLHEPTPCAISFSATQVDSAVKNLAVKVSLMF